MSLPLTDAELFGLQQPGLFDGSTGEVLYAQKSAQTFSSFFADQGYTTNGGSGTFLLVDGDASDLTVSGSPLSSLFDGSIDFLCNTITIGGGVQIQSISGSNGVILMQDGDGSTLTFQGQNVSTGVALAFPNTPSGSSNTLLFDNGDASSCTVSGHLLSGLFDGTVSGVNINSATIGQLTVGTENVGIIVDQTASATAFVLFGGTRQCRGSNGTDIIYDFSTIAAFAGSIKTALLDTGWTANADAGSKTAVVGSSASNATIATALDIVSSGAGTLLKNVAEKLKAIEAILASGKIPNN